jgi:predicted RNA methylase
MSKHESGHSRVERDFYPTPTWVIDALAEHVNLAGRCVWECACGDGRMAQALKAAGASVYSSDVVDRGYCDELLDFTSEQQPRTDFDDIVTNPPYGSRGKLAEAFIVSGLRRISRIAGTAAAERFRLRQNSTTVLRRLRALCRQARAHQTHRVVQALRRKEGSAEGKHCLVPLAFTNRPTADTHILRWVWGRP